ncbi:hypothetical protein QFC22_002252 [Naganishia vaughanmartiniae]|uniref:Uncharacterized protein n=1 Tax=Naganishia vaughanmartiniae TaxID=1424756 RepID=A0ACC2XEE5_9TREE|nr:hypothetical protein QFC22_002252 [Naganishia vaughanmartiniae]
MAATLIRQTIREESPLIIHAATEAASLSASSSSSAAVGSMAANAARTTAVASVEAASATTGLLGGVTASAGRIGSEVVAKEVGVVGGGLAMLASRHWATTERSLLHKAYERGTPTVEGRNKFPLFQSSVLASHFAAVRQTATHLPPTGTISNTTIRLLETTVTEPLLTTTPSKVPTTLTSRIAQQALSKSTTTTTSSSSTLARLDLNVAQTGETIKEAASNALQEGLKEQLDKAMDMHKLVVRGAGVGSASATAAAV